MTFYFPNTDPAYIYKRAGTTTDPYLFLHETAQVSNGIVTLKEIPAFANKVITKKLDGTTLTEVTTDTLQSNQFRVDYSTGIVYLHSSLESATLTFDFYGTGYVSFPASRVWVDTNTDDSNKTIQQLFSDMDNLKTNWLVAVNTYSSIATTYPTPKLGDTVQTTDDSRIYRFNGDAWVNTQQYTENAITNFQNRLDSLSKVSNEYEWTATAGQVVYILPSGSNLDDQWLEVFVGGALVSPSLIRKDSQTQFTLLVDPSKIPAGVIVSARWVEGYIAATIGHHNTHELGGNDEIDVTHLKNYNEQIGTPIANLSKAPSEYEWTATAGQLTYVLPSGQTYDTTSKWLQVSIGGAVIADSLIQKDSATQFTLLVSSSNIPAGITVMARWVSPYIPATSGHHTTHEVGGYDEIDVTKLRNYQEQIASPLADKATQITNLQNSLGQQTKLKGVDIPVYLNYTVTDLENAILRAKNTNGANLAVLSISYNQTNSTDSTMIANTNNANLSAIIDYCNSIGMQVAVKMHCASNSGAAISPTDIPTWFTNWQTACLNVASTCQSKNVVYLGISNELINMTSANSSNWQSLINAIKAQYPNLQLFLSVNKNEYSTCVIYNMFDIIGFNFYPAMTLNGTGETDLNMRSAFHNDLSGFNLIGSVRSLKQTYNKPVWITEVGCPSYANALIETSMFNGLTTYDETTQNFYFKYMFDTVWNLSSIDAMCIWAVGDSQSAVNNHNTYFTYQYKQAESIVNQYWKGV